MDITQSLKVNIRGISSMSTEANFAIKCPSLGMALLYQIKSWHLPLSLHMPLYEKNDDE